MQALLPTDAPGEDAGAWTLEGVLDVIGEWALQGVKEPLRFAAQAVLMLSIGCAAGLVVSGGWRTCVEATAVLAFGTLSLSAMMDLTRLVGQTASECQTYLAAFVPVYSGIALLGGQTAGAAAYSGLFYAMSGLLSTAIQSVLLPVLQIYFCLSASAVLWGGQGLGRVAALFGGCLKWGLRCCGTVFTMVLGLQSALSGVSDSAALRMGKSVLSGMVPVVGDAAAAALSASAASLHLLKGTLAAAGVAALASCFAPVLVRCGLYGLAFRLAGILAEGCGQSRSGQICALYADGAQLCGSVLILYAFMVVLSTALLLISGNGG